LSGQYTLTVSGTLSGLTLYLEAPSSSSAAFYVDDLVVQQSVSGPGGEDGQTAILWDEVHQRIDGFGASSAWRSSWSTALGDMFFSTNSGTGYARDGSPYPYTGIGLSLLRTRIAPGATTVEQAIMQMAQARGARVWSAPWSPEAQFKSNGNVNGGSFVGNAANYQAYANQLAGYVADMKNQYGVNLYAISVQNEPDANVTTYESCKWTAQQIHDFIPYLSSALDTYGVGSTRIMLPESQNWTDPQGLRLTTLNDPATAALVDIIANHNYVPDNVNGDQNPPAVVNNHGKDLWETEVSLLSGSDSSINNGLYWAERVHLFMTVPQANAWHYWWLCAYGTGNEGLCDDNDVPAKRMYAVGNYSRFVRPGDYRIGTTNSGTSWVSAYKNRTNGTFAVVAINRATNAVMQTFHLNGFTTDAVRPWVTSATLSLSSQTVVAVTNNTFAYSLPAMSVVTFVGQDQTAPTLSLSHESGHVVLSWPATAGGFQLESSAGTSPFDWNPVSPPPKVVNDIFLVTNTVSGESAFYRLARP
jgi:glucuronoarabinoxylan endo-1,4-beta-xylanase